MDKKEKETTEETPIEEMAEGTDGAAEEAPDALSQLQLELDEAKQMAESNLDGWQRTQAEFINYKKRMEREQVRMREDAAARVIKSFLPVLDDLDRALSNRPGDGEGQVWAEGVELVIRKMETILDSEGIKVMDALGKEFDPNFHEAISQEASEDHNSGEIIEVIQKGYLIGERVIRPAMVRVAI